MIGTVATAARVRVDAFGDAVNDDGAPFAIVHQYPQHALLNRIATRRFPPLFGEDDDGAGGRGAPGGCRPDDEGDYDDADADDDDEAARGDRPLRSRTSYKHQPWAPGVPAEHDWLAPPREFVARECGDPRWTPSRAAAFMLHTPADGPDLGGADLDAAGATAASSARHDDHRETQQVVRRASGVPSQRLPDRSRRMCGG